MKNHRNVNSKKNKIPFGVFVGIFVSIIGLVVIIVSFVMNSAIIIILIKNLKPILLKVLKKLL